MIYLVIFYKDNKNKGIYDLHVKAVIILSTGVNGVRLQSVTGHRILPARATSWPDLIVFDCVK